MNSVEVNPRLSVQELHLEDDTLRFMIPFSMSVSGPSQSGKTEFILNLVENRHQLFSSEFSRIVFCIPESLAHRPNTAFDRLKKSFPAAELVNGLPDISKLNLDLNQSPCLLIIDDQMNALLDSKEMVELLCIKIHHFQICTIFRL